MQTEEEFTEVTHSASMKGKRSPLQDTPIQIEDNLEDIGGGFKVVLPTPNRQTQSKKKGKVDVGTERSTGRPTNQQIHEKVIQTKIANGK